MYALYPTQAPLPCPLPCPLPWPHINGLIIILIYIQLMNISLATLLKNLQFKIYYSRVKLNTNRK